MLKHLSLILISLLFTNLSFCFSDTLKIQKFCAEISNSKLLGLGESTHGTKEFTETRLQIVKELVTNHNFRLFILEADYFPCLLINDYLVSGKGELNKLLKTLRLWPWINHTFLEMLKWIRNFNIDHPNDPVLFYGMDSQLSEHFTISDTLNDVNPVVLRDMKTILSTNNRPKKIVSKLYELSGATENILLKYYLLNKIDSICGSDKYHDINARDKNMSIMVSSIVQQTQDSKAIIWAHNGHIMKSTPKYSYYIPLGKYLSDQYGVKYKSIGFDFCSGSFRASNLESNNSTKPTEFDLLSVHDHVCQLIQHSGSESIISCDTLKRQIIINNIGAGYIFKPTDKMRFYTELKKNCELDFLILLDRSSPTIGF